MSEVLITNTEIVTHHDSVPRFAAQADCVAVRSGEWNESATWRGGIPLQESRVQIPSGIQIIVSGAAKAGSVEVSGELTFSPHVDSELSLADLVVMPNGVLIATPNLDQFVTITFIDSPLRAEDPKQYGNGLIVFGKCVLRGRAVKPYSRLAVDALAGSSEITLQDAVNWRPGDELVFPDTRHINPVNHPRYYTYEPQWETRIIESVDGTKVRLKSPLRYGHVAPRSADGTPTVGFDGKIVAPHVGNLTRNITLRSENPSGVRGHVLAIGRCHKDIRYTAFEGLGRTKAAALDNTDATHIGTNQIGRYSDHNHHISGPREGIAVGDKRYQVVSIGNSYVDNLKWAATIHNTHYGLFSECVYYDTDGSAIATEGGNEFGNVIEKNLVIRVQNPNLHLPVTGIGVAATNDGAIGDGYWFASAMNEVRGNIAANISKTGFMFWPKNIVSPSDRIRMVRIPLIQGDDTDEDGQYRLVNAMVKPVDNFVGNEVYGATTSAIDIWQVGNRNWFPTATPTVLKNTTVWHVTGSGIWFYYTSDYILDGWLQRGAPYAISQHISKGGPSNPSSGTAIVHGGSDAITSLIRRGDIQGMTAAFVNRGGGHSDEITIDDSYFDNFANIVVRPYQSGAGDGSRDTRIRNCRFGYASNPSGRSIQMEWQPATIEAAKFKETVTLESNGKKYDIYYDMQSPNAILPLHGGKSFFPEAGITNAAGFAKYGYAPVGRLFPGDETEGKRLANSLRITGLAIESGTVPLPPPVIPPVVPPVPVPKSAIEELTTAKAAIERALKILGQ